MGTIKVCSFRFRFTTLNTGFQWICNYTAAEWKKKIIYMSPVRTASFKLSYDQIKPY